MNNMHSKAKSTYSMNIELKFITERNIEILLKQLSQLSIKENLQFSHLVEVINTHMSLILFGCSIEIGICTDVTSKSIEFFTDPNYHRKIERGESPNCFLALDRKQLVIEDISKSNNPNPRMNFEEGNHIVVYVPMLGTSSAQGILEIYGLQTTISSKKHSIYERNPQILKGMMDAKDYKFINTIRLWKLPPTSPTISEDGEVSKYYGVNAFIVAGFCTSMAFAKRGIPFFGGPRYTITWENGEKEEDIAASELIKIYRQTPQSLGCINSLDDYLTEKLLEIAGIAGNILEKQRSRSFLSELHQKLSINNLKALRISEICIQSLSTMIHGVKELSLIGYQSNQMEDNNFHVLTQFISKSKHSNNMKTNEDYQYNSYKLIQLYIDKYKSSYMKTKQFLDVLIQMDENNTEWFILEVKFPIHFKWNKKLIIERYFLVLHRIKLLSASTLDILTFQNVIKEMENSIDSSWSNDLRKRMRKQIIQELDHQLSDLKDITPNEICYNAIQSIGQVLIGANIYIGLLEPGGNILKYIVSNNQSKMEGKKLYRGEGVSFDAIDNLKTIILKAEDLNKGNVLTEGTKVQVYYGKKLYKAKIHKIRGHEKYDIWYEIDQKVEAGVDANRIIPENFAFRLKLFGKVEYPFVCITIRHKNKPIGILGIDNFSKVPKSMNENHPESDLIQFLEIISKSIGTDIDLIRKKMSFQVLHNLSKNQFVELKDIMEAIYDVLIKTMQSIAGIVATNICYESIIPSKQHGVNIIYQSGEVSNDIINSIKRFNPLKSSLKPIQKFGEKIVWILCKLRPAVRGEQGKIFIIALISNVPIKEPDYVFLSNLQKLVSGTLQTMITHKAVTEMRYEALKEIKILSQNSIIPSRKYYFNQVVDNVQSCFYSANMYVSILSQYNKTLEYILASNQSRMLGKTLSRSEKRGVSFEVIDNIQPIAVSSTSKDAFRLVHFGPRQQFEYPFIGIPLVAHIDAVLGILSIDHCEDPSSAGGSGIESLRDTVVFFSAVGSCISKAICYFKEEDARNRLEQIAREANSYNEGIREIKKVILDLLPFAKRVLEMVYEPHDITLSLTETGSSMPKINFTQDDFIVILQIKRAICIPLITNASIKCYWLGDEKFSMDVDSDGKVNTNVWKIYISKGMNIEKIQIVFTLVGNYESFSRKEIAQKNIGMNYLYNTPLFIMEHYFDSINFSNVRVGNFQLITKLFQKNDVIGFVIHDVQLKGVENAFEYVQSKNISKDVIDHSNKSSNVGEPLLNQTKLGDIVTLIKWNNEIISKTPSIPPKSTMNWSGLNIYTKLESYHLDENSIFLDIWDTKLNNDLSNAYGRLVLNANELFEYFKNGSSWLKVNELIDTHKKESLSIIPNVFIKLIGEIITADNMSDYQMIEEFNRGPKIKDDSKRLMAGDHEENIYSQQICEIGILCARDLISKINTLVIIYFNGEEVGRTSVIPESINPIWNEEYFHLQVPASDALEDCVLQLELNHIDSITNKEEIIGCISITGKQLLNFLANTKLKHQWFDILSYESNKMIIGELKISGRPLQVNVTGLEDDAIEKDIIELNLISFSNFKPLNSNLIHRSNKINSYADIYFNERHIYRTHCIEGDTSGIFNQEKVKFRLPNNKSLFQSILQIKLYHIDEDNLQEASRYIASALLELTGSALGKFIGQNGMITKHYPLEYIDSRNNSTDLINIPEIIIRGGPINSIEIYEDDGNELFLDILAGTGFPFRSTNILGNDISLDDYRPNIFCEVTWNTIKIGKTAILNSSICPIWNKQRFILKVPLIPQYTDLQGTSLQFCNLRLDFYDKVNEILTELIGYLVLSKNDIADLFENSKAYIKWINIHLDSKNESITNTNENHQCKVKLRGGFIGIPESQQKLPDEYILHIHSARDLSNTDIFGGADSYVIIEWNGEEIGRTQVIVKSINPKYNKEIFILTDDLILRKDPQYQRYLSLQVWSKQTNASSVFLGRVHLMNDDLSHLLHDDSTDKTIEYILTTSSDLTTEENQLVKGFLTISCNKLENFPQNIEIKKDAILWIVSASDLPSSNSFGINSDVFCKVFRKYDREGSEFIEIFKTKISYKTFNPIFSNEFVPISIPAYEDWTGFEIRIEVWDSFQEMLGYILLSEEESYQLFNQEDEEIILNQITLPLYTRHMDQKNATNANKQTAALNSSFLTIAGGLKAPFEYQWSLSNHSIKPSIIQEVKKLDTLSKSNIDNDDNNDLESAFISIMNLNSENKNDFNLFPSIYCIVKYDKITIGKTSTIESDWKNQKFELKINPNLYNKLLSIEIYSKINNNNNNNNNKEEDLLIGSLQLDKSKDLQNIFDPSNNISSFPIVFTDSILLNRKLSNVWKLSLHGEIPRLQQEYSESHSKLIHNDDIPVENIDRKQSIIMEEIEIEIKLLNAIGLAQVNAIGRSADAFALFYWNNQKEPIYKTDVVSNSLDPYFDCELFIITKKAGINLNDCVLRIVLYNKNLLTSPTFLGEVIIKDNHWNELINSRSESFKQQFLLNKSNIEKVKQNYVQGKIEISATILPNHKKSAIFNSELSYNSKDIVEIELNILAATGLANINGNGQCDTYCKVKWGRIELGSTQTISSMLNPIWFDSKLFILRIPKNWISDRMFDETQSDKQLHTSQNFDDLMKDIILSISVFTYDKQGIEQFLGLVNITGEVLKNCINSSYYHRQWYSLVKSTKLKSNLQKNVQGALQLLFSIKPPDGQVNKINNYNEIEILINSAQNLILSTKNNHYETFVHCRWNGKSIGRTYNYEDSINPMWENEKFLVKVPGFMRLEDCCLEFEVWQCISEIKMKCVGMISISNETLKNFVDDSNFTSQWFPLHSSTTNISENLFAPKIVEVLTKYSSQDLSTVMDLGKLEIQCGYIKNKSNESELFVRYELQIYSAINIGIVDSIMQSSDPYVICKWNGREIGRTPHVINTVNPIWTKQKFFFSLDPDADISINLLQIEIWNFKLKKKGEFLGCLYLSGEKFSDTFNQLLKSGRTFFDLEFSPLLAEQQQLFVQGQIEVSIQLSKADSDSDSVDNNMKWMEARDRNAGIPILKLSILSIQDLPILEPVSMTPSIITPTNTSTRFLSSVKSLVTTSNTTSEVYKDLLPYCIVTWMDEIVFETTPIIYNKDKNNSAIWSSDQTVYLKIPTNIDSINANSILLLRIWDYSSGLKGAFLGCIEFSFASLIRLYTGKFSFLLQENNTKDNDNLKLKASKIGNIRGSLTFSIDFMFSFWNSMKSVVPKVYLRKLSIYAANNLPLVNNFAPSTKCIIFFDGVIKAKTIVIPNHTSPTWPEINLEIIIDTTKTIEIMIIVYHVNATDKKEVILGQELLPSEYLLQPPHNKFDLFLGPSSKKPSPAFKFSTSGSVSIQITGSNSLSKAMMPYSSRLSKPVEALATKDVRGIGRDRLTKQDNILNGDTISLEDRLWLGTAYDFSIPQIISSKPNWIMMPLYDIGIKMGPRKSDLIGTIPGFKFALCIEREEDKANVSDPLILNEITYAVSSCITKLRMKDINKSLREKRLRCLNNELKNILAYHNDPSYCTSAVAKQLLDDNDMFLEVAKLLETNINICFPGTNVKIARFSQDFDAINYYSYNLLNESNECLVLYKDQGCDWELMGRSLNKSLIIKSCNDIKDKVIALFTSFPFQRFPRISVPLRSGDASLGFFQIENFDLHTGGLLNKHGLYDENEVRLWLENLGEICGEAIYKSKEDQVLEKVLKYSQLWNSNIYKLLANVLKDSFNVLQGCKMMEIIEIDSIKNISSLIESKPLSTEVLGSEVILDSFQFSIHLENLFDSDKLFHQDDVGNDLDTDSLHSSIESSDKIIDNNMIDIVVGIRYGVTEQIQIARYDPNNQIYSISKTHIILDTDRIINISVYHINQNDLTILAEYSGKVNFITFEEKEFKCSLSAPVPSGCTFTNPIKYNVYTALIWPKKYEFKSKTSIGAISGFKLKIKRARDLLGANSDGTSDPFCEIIYHNKVIFQTQIKKKSLSPVWDEEFKIPFSGMPSSLIIDMYDMNFMRKGEFLGKIEILHDHLINGTGQEIEYNLKINDKINIKKQTKVGGILTVEYSIDNNIPSKNNKNTTNDTTIQSEDIIDDDETLPLDKQSKSIKSKSKSTKSPSITIPKEIWIMKNPSFEITIKSANELNKVTNLFGGSSADPFVAIYVGANNEDPIAKTNVINNTLNPKWNETFSVRLNIEDLNKDKSKVEDFPTIKLEVMNYSNFKAISSLGYCLIPPSWYLIKTNTNGDFKLKTSSGKNDKAKSTIKGTLQFSIKIVDNILNIKKQSFVYSPQRYLEPLIYLEVHILKAKNLMVANLLGGKSDPYVIIRWKETICGETISKKNTLNPQWNNEKFLICLSEAHYNEIGSISLEVWDKDFFKNGEFMGEIRLNTEILLHPPTGSIELPLQSKEGLTQKANKISGNLTFKLIKRLVLQKPKFEQLNFVILNEIPPQLDIIKLNMIYDPNEELLRQKKEGSFFPKILEKTTNEMDKYIKNPFERTGLISELHYGQLLSALQRADHTILKSDLFDMMCYPTFEKLNPTKKVVVENENSALFLMARYHSGKVPHRDVSFMGKLHQNICQGISIIKSREERINNFKLLKENLELLSSVEENTSGIIVQSLLDFELTVQCKTHLYLLNPDGITFNECSSTTGEIQYDMRPADEMIHLFARICRYNVIIQKYRGEYSVIDLEWDTFMQPNLPSLDSVKSKFEELEGFSILNKLISICDETRKDGMIIAPLIAYNEVLLGLLVLSTVDRYPSAEYRIQSMMESSEPLTNTSKNISKNPFIVVRKLEHGLLNSIKDNCKVFANNILSSRIGNSYKKIKSFPIQIDTHPLKIIRYAFRLLVTDIPAIRKISIWAVDFNRKPVTKLITIKQIDISKSKKSFAGGFFSNTKTIPSTTTNVDLNKQNKINPQNIKPNEEEDEDSDIDSETIIPKILAGCFGFEDPKYLLNTKIERGLHEGMKLNYKSNTLKNDIQVIDQVQENYHDNLAKWKVNTPISLQENMIENNNLLKAQLSNHSLNSYNNESLDEHSSIEQPTVQSHSYLKENKELSDLIYSEIYRCINILKIKTFSTVNGNVLSQLGTNKSSKALIDSLFLSEIESMENIISNNNNKIQVNNNTTTTTTTKKNMNYQYFLSISTNGIGNDDGWGIANDGIEKIVNNIAELIDNNLSKYKELKNKK